MAFLREIDQVKNVLRKNRILDGSRQENDAEHAWHLAVMACILAETSNEKNLDIGKVIQMVLVHDLVEIDTGDVFVYDRVQREKQREAEVQAGHRIFGLLPADQSEKMRGLWEEFEGRETPEARFAAALDRLEPILLNAAQGGWLWREHGLSRKRVEEINQHMAQGSERLWDYARGLIEVCDREGVFAHEPSETMRFRQVRSPEEIRTTCELAREIWIEYYVKIIGKDQVEYMLEKFQSEDAVVRQLDEGHEYYLADWHGEPVGYAACMPGEKGGSVFLSKIYIRKDLRGNGLGCQLLTFLETLCQERGFSSIWLTVNKRNHDSIVWYERRGFNRSESLIQDIGHGFVMDDYKMVKPLEPVSSPLS